MKISNRNNQINFTSTPIHSLRLPRANGKGFVRGVLSELNPGDLTDRNAVRNISKTWKKNSDLIKLIHDDFFGNTAGTKYYAIELMGNGTEKLDQRIIALSEAEIVPETNFSLLSYLVVKSGLTAKERGRTIKNIGEALFGGICNHIRSLRRDCLYFTSINNGFFATTFQKAGITEPRINPQLEFTQVFLPWDSMRKYINYWRKNFCL